MMNSFLLAGLVIILALAIWIAIEYRYMLCQDVEDDAMREAMQK